jgi:hypothetical protein
LSDKYRAQPKEGEGKMGVVKKDAVIAIWVDGAIDKEIVCLNCASHEEFNEADPEEFVMENTTDDLIFCDRCKKRVQ